MARPQFELPPAARELIEQVRALEDRAKRVKEELGHDLTGIRTAATEERATVERELADQHRQARAKQIVGYPAAGKRHQVNRSSVRPIDGRRFGNGKTESPGFYRRFHKEQQQTAHAIIAETLPHLCEEERRQPCRLAANS